MTLMSLVAAYDSAALIALTNKGTVLRATKDVAAGRVVIKEQTPETAIIAVADTTVTLAGKKIEQAQCTCTATGPCRHIVAAVLALIETPPAANTEKTPPALTPLTFTVEQIEKFAGKDWPLALDLVDQAVIGEADKTRTRSITFADMSCAVTLPVGQNLREALYKGPKPTWKRRIVAAAALALALFDGAELPEAIITQQRSVEPEILSQAAAALGHAAIALASGNVALAKSTVFSIAISARAEAAPRLAAELRAIAESLDESKLRLVENTPTEIFRRIAFAFGLVCALQKQPDDPRLVGQMMRSYVPSGDKSLAYLGGETWQTRSGAKGHTTFLMDRNDATFYRAVTARAAGQDMHFEPERVWKLPLWNIARPLDLAGHILHLKDAAIAPDRSLSQHQDASFGREIKDLNDLIKGKATITDWSDLSRQTAQQLGIGLRRQAGEAMAILKPKSVSNIYLDEINQQQFSIWRDATGHEIWAEHPKNMCMSHDQWHGQVDKIEAAFVGMTPTVNGADVRLISVWLKDNPIPFVLSQSIFPKPSLMSGLKRTVLEKFTPDNDFNTKKSSPLELFYERALEALLYQLANHQGLPDSLLQEAAELGQTALLECHNEWVKTKTMRDGMFLAYAIGFCGFD